MRKKKILNKSLLIKEVFHSDDNQENNQKRLGNREYSLTENHENGFSLEELHNLTSYAKKKAYCREHLMRLGTGSSRMVFELNDETVLKLAINKKGLAQNEVEWDMRNELSFTAKVFDIDDDGYWVIMEKAEKLTEKEFKELQGYSLKNLSEYVSTMIYTYTNGRKGIKYSLPEEFIENMHEDEFASEIIDAEMSYNMKWQDMVTRQNLGVVSNNGERHVVIIDLGYNEDVHKQHYSENIVNKQNLIIERIRNEFDDNLPCSEIFLNDVDPNRMIDHDLVDNFMSKNSYKSFPIKSVRVDMIIPTQKNLDNNKLLGLDVNQDTGAILYEENGKYYIIDGHHRIAKNILNNNTSIKAYVKECTKRLHESAELTKNQELLQKKIGILKQGFDIICQDLQFSEIPKLNLINDLNYTSQNKSFAAYSPGTKEVFCVIAGRNTADCMRSIAHELMHHKQNLEYRLYNGAGEDGTDIENEANSYAGKIMRRLGREIENIFEDSEKLTENVNVITKGQLLTK